MRWKIGNFTVWTLALHWRSNLGRQNWTVQNLDGKSGHSNEKWSMSKLITELDTESAFSNTQQRLAIGDSTITSRFTDGGPELVLAVVDENTNDPTVVSSLTTSTPTDFDWEVVLDVEHTRSFMGCIR